MAVATRGLGKGLSALISETAQPPAAVNVELQPAAGAEPGLQTLATNSLQPGKYQPRTRFDEAALVDLSQSIARHGIMQPILVRKLAKQSGRYEIVGGERRWRAAKMAGIKQVPVIVKDLADDEALEIAIVENVQRQDLGPLEESTGYQRLLQEFEYTQEELATAVGKSRSHIANLLRLQGLPEEVKDMLDTGKLTMGHARALLTSESPVELAHEIIKGGLSVRQAESFSKGAKKAPKTAKPTIAAPRQEDTGSKDSDILALEASLSESLGLRVSITDRGQSGEIRIAYDSLSQLDDILRRLGESAD